MAKSKDPIMAYNVKIKEKEEMVKDIVVNNHSGRYMATGIGATGAKLSVTLGADRAKQLVKDKVAKKGKGWD